MAETRREPQHHSGMHLSDILFALFKRKWIIILFALLGIIAAATFYFLFPPAYDSPATLPARSVLGRGAIDSRDRPQSTPQSRHDPHRAYAPEAEARTRCHPAPRWRRPADARNPRVHGPPAPRADAASRGGAARAPGGGRPARDTRRAPSTG